MIDMHEKVEASEIKERETEGEINKRKPFEWNMLLVAAITSFPSLE